MANEGKNDQTNDFEFNECYKNFLFYCFYNFELWIFQVFTLITVSIGLIKFVYVRLTRKEGEHVV